MAPVGMVGVLGWFSPEVGVISLVAFLVLSVTLVALCAKCNRSSSNAYDVSGAAYVDGRGGGGGGGSNGTTTTQSGNASDLDSSGSTWRNHKNMPPHTLSTQRPKAGTN